MVSVLIPIYNTDVRAFVKDVKIQLEKNRVEGEILCLDDGSKEEYKILNREISNLPYVQYKELNVNIGRSKIRNLLAQTAKHKWLLFVDCDSGISNPDFLSDYLKHATNSKVVLYGGTNYSVQKPSAKLLLHWLYGSKRECIAPEIRNQNKFGTFKTNNFYTHSEVFEKVHFNETINGYGHEDTLFAKDLDRNGFDILHINNPLQHNGLEPNDVFLNKQNTAIVNLALLYKKGLVGNEIRIIKFYNRVKSFRIMFLVKKFYLRNNDVLKENLCSANPKLTNLDRLKFAWLLEELEK